MTQKNVQFDNIIPEDSTIRIVEDNPTQKTEQSREILEEILNEDKELDKMDILPTDVTEYPLYKFDEDPEAVKKWIEEAESARSSKEIRLLPDIECDQITEVIKLSKSIKKEEEPSIFLAFDNNFDDWGREVELSDEDTDE